MQHLMPCLCEFKTFCSDLNTFKTLNKVKYGKLRPQKHCKCLVTIDQLNVSLLSFERNACNIMEVK